MNVLITGGAGFIGTQVARRLLREGYELSVLDNFSAQVHAGEQELARDLRDHVRLFRGDVRDQDLIHRALEKQDVLVHMAAETGTGQSMYEISRYEEVNLGGTAAILNCLMQGTANTLRRIVLASSRAVYGEGTYKCIDHGIIYPGQRSLTDLQAAKFEPCCPICRTSCEPVATTEDAPLNALSFYGLTKQVQEQMIQMFARARQISALALRFQNVYGPGQSLQNPYTGILAIFSNLARSNSPIQIFEDGQESRDFVYIDDVVEATRCCINTEDDLIDSYNVGTGKRTTVLQIAQEIVTHFGSKSELRTTGAFRHGDIRHNFADLNKVRRALGFAPRTSLHAGLKKFLAWAQECHCAPTAYECSLQELREKGLLRA